MLKEEKFLWVLRCQFFWGRNISTFCRILVVVWTFVLWLYLIRSRSPAGRYNWWMRLNNSSVLFRIRFILTWLLIMGVSYINLRSSRGFWRKSSCSWLRFWASITSGMRIHVRILQNFWSLLWSQLSTLWFLCIRSCMCGGGRMWRMWIWCTARRGIKVKLVLLLTCCKGSRLLYSSSI